MTEKIIVNEKEIWVTIEPHFLKDSSDNLNERYSATYYAADPATGPGGILLVDHENKPLTFQSPVEALTFTTEKLSGE